MPDAGMITTYESGVDLVVEWKIENVFNLPETDGAAYFSPCFSFGGKKWFLGIFPNGSSRNDSSGHVDLDLFKCRSDRSIKQSFSLSLKTEEGEKYNEQHYTKDFDNGNWFHGFNRFIPRSELSRRRSDLAPDGTLTVICMMKSSTSAGSDSNIASSSAECCHCKGTFNADSLTSHQKKCQHRPVKCPDCLEIVVLQKWFDEHECQQERAEEKNTTKRQRMKDFDDNHNFIHEFNPFIPRSELTRRWSELMPEGVLMVICTMKRSTSAGSATGKYPEHPFVEVPIQDVEPSTQSVEASIEAVEEKCEACASGSSIGFQDDDLRHDLKELFLKKEDCDIIIKVKDSEFPAHRVILKARSPVFASTFRHDMKENTTGVLEIQDCDSSTFSNFLCFLYCGDVGIISQENVFGLFTAADKYQVLKLRAKCLEFMKMNITVDTFCETLTLALRHSEIKLIKLCTDYFKKNIPKIIVTVKWQIFLAENPTESNELLVKCFVPNSS